MEIHPNNHVPCGLYCCCSDLQDNRVFIGGNSESSKTSQ